MAPAHSQNAAPTGDSPPPAPSADLTDRSAISQTPAAVPNTDTDANTNTNTSTDTNSPTLTPTPTPTGIGVGVEAAGVNGEAVPAVTEFEVSLPSFPGASPTPVGRVSAAGEMVISSHARAEVPSAQPSEEQLCRAALDASYADGRHVASGAENPASRSVVALLVVTRAGDASETCRGGSVR